MKYKMTRRVYISREMALLCGSGCKCFQPDFLSLSLNMNGTTDLVIFSGKIVRSFGFG